MDGTVSEKSYTNRVRDMPTRSWTFRTYYNIVREGIDTKWLKDIRKINSELKTAET